MDDSTTPRPRARYSPRAFLAAIAHRLRWRQLWQPVDDKVVIHQKTVKHTPLQKLRDAFICILTGARGMVEVEKRLRNDPVLQQAFGRECCAEQSSIQDTLDACTVENVLQLKQASTAIYRKHSQGFRHDYKTHWQILDADMTGMPCGPKAEFATKGYFAGQPNRRGRQLARCLATRYHEIVCEELYDGKHQLQAALIPLLEQANQVLELNTEQRARTIIRLDSGGGTVEDINWVLTQGFAYHGKDYSGRRAEHLCQSVTEWLDDPKCPGRQVGWVTDPHPYLRPVVRIAARCRKANGQWGVGLLVSTLSAADVIALTNQPCHYVKDAHAVLLAYIYFYDARGGGIETANKEDKQGLGLTARNKKRFAAQQMLVLLAALAHNVIVWTTRWLVGYTPKLVGYGILRMVRDVFTTTGFIQMGADGRPEHVVLNVHDRLAAGLVDALRDIFQSEHIALNLGET